jgi:two-component system, cell cycle sensor histidine kinase and response regulator CckA
MSRNGSNPPLSPGPAEPKLDGSVYAVLLEAIDQSVIFTDVEGRIRFWNPGASRIFGYPADEMLGETPASLYPDEDPSRFVRDLDRILAGEDFVGEWRGRRRDGSTVLVDIRTTVVRDPGGTALGFLGVAREITEGKWAEPTRLRQEVLEAVGRLAGGVAHESNNQLTVVLGETTLLLGRSDLPVSLRQDVTRIHHAAERVAEITRQLLGFGRRQMRRPRLLDLNGAITRLLPQLEARLDSGMELRLTLSPGVPAVRMDEAQLQQVLTNLVLNGRDALSNGGTVFLETREAVISGSSATVDGLIPGRYAELVVRDLGAGMDPETLAHVFEPFFTTKGQGQGTGLGLASVYGIVKQSGGYVFAQSSPDQGTSFRVLMPAAVEK